MARSPHPGRETAGCMAGRNNHRGGNMDDDADLIRQERQQKKKDVEKELADLRDWMSAHAEDGPGHTDATRELIRRLEGDLAEIDKL